jgi:uncharacterized membrane protein
MFAVNPLNIFYSQEVRMSAMNLFLNAGAVFYLIKLPDKKSGWTEMLMERELYFYILFRTAALYTHYFSFFIFVSELIYLAIILRNNSDIKIKKLIVSISAVIILYLPWIPTMLDHLSRGQPWRYENHSPLKELVNFIKDINLGLYYHYSNLKLVNYITIFLVSVYCFSLFTSIYFFIRELKTKSIIVNICFFLVTIPLIFALILSFNQRIEFYRYLSIVIPFIIILIVHSLSKLNKGVILISFTSILIAINIFGLSVQFSFNFKNDDYRPIIKHIEEHFNAGERIYVEPHYMGWSIDYYKKQLDLRLPNPVNIRYGWVEIMDSINVQKPERLWVILDYSAVDTDNYPEYIKDLEREFTIEDKTTYYLAPSKVELFSLSKKTY